MKYYHGTTDKFFISNEILPPIITGNLREESRNKYQDKVFLTTSLLSAQYFAYKACQKYSGHGIIYEVEPIGIMYYPNPNTNEYIVDKAKIIKIVSKYDEILKKWIIV